MVGGEKFDVIIVLGRGIEADGSLPEDPLARVRKGAELFKAGLAPRMIMSGEWSYRLAVPPVRTEASALKEYAISLGIPSEIIIEEAESKDTLGNAYFAKVRYCVPNGWTRIVVVTSEDHLKRSRYIFEKVFGAGYTIHFEISERVVSDEHFALELEHERKSLVVLERWVGDIANGDDVAIWQLMSTKHPGYSTSPDLDREAFMKMVDGGVGR